jgi:hypothetical protein
MSEKYSTIRRHNYTISIVDKNSNALHFRDITGEDLEFFERFFEESKDLSINDVMDILEKINLSSIRINQLTPKVIKEVFEIVVKEIFCNFMPKLKWLEVCYALQNNSFVAMNFFESQPMTKIMAMIQVHQDAISELNKSQSK